MNSMAERSYNGRNLLAGQNGDFENAPPFVAATTTSSRWIDGTAAGSTSDASYKWSFTRDAGTVSGRFDPDISYSGGHSIKVDATDVTGRGRVVFGNDSGTGSSLVAATLAAHAIRVKPFSQYQISYWIKGINLAGSGGRISVHEHNSNGIRQRVNQPAGSLTGTFDWTFATGAFTTLDSSYIVLSAELASAGIQTVWFDDISLTEVLPARSTATSRTPATNRRAVRDMGTALRFGTTNTDRVFVENSAGEVTTNITDATYSLWVCPTAAQGSVKYIFSIPATTGNNRRYIQMNSTNFIATNFGSTAFTTTTRITVGNWAHIATTVTTGGTYIVYINGVPVRESTFTIGTGTADLCIGNFSDAGTDAFIGLIDEPRIWNRALTATEVQNLYFNNIVPRGDLVLEYLFNEASGSTALDTSGNGNNGTITGATYTTDVPLKLRTNT